MKCLSHSARFPLLLLIAAGLLPARAVQSAGYPVIGFDLPLNAPLLTTLTADVPVGRNSVPLNLNFTYDGRAGFLCGAGSTVDGLPAACSATQKNSAFRLNVTAPQTRLTLSGRAPGSTATAAYQGPKGRRAGGRIAVALQTGPAPVPSRVVLAPELRGRSALAGTGSIESGYGPSRPAAALRGTKNQARVAWTFKQGRDKLDFTGKESGNAWVGRLKGNVGPATIASNVSIPLAALAYPLSVVATGGGSGRVTSVPAGIDCPGACTASFPYGTAVTLTAAPAVGSAFVGWIDDAGCAHGNPAIAGPILCTATFIPRHSCLANPDPATGCGNSGSAGLARFHGLVTKGDGQSPPEAAAGVKVAIRSDKDGNGSIGAGESVEALTDAGGRFDQRFATVEGRPVTVDFNLEGYSQTPKVFASVFPGAEIPVNSSLRALKTLTRAGDAAVSDDGRLKLAALPAEVASVSGLVFNPVTETSQFPGEFADSAGNLLISSVFAHIEARDANGNEVKNLAADTLLRMELPRDTWPTIRDLTPGNGRIDVPLYYFDEADGQWKRADKDGWVTDGTDAPLAETALPGIRDGSRNGPIFAAGNISHLSYWNVDWPIDTHGCVTGRIVDSNGNPVAGALVSARGVSYTGSSAPTTTDTAGRFCVDAMRSEQPGEDVDGDGVLGEDQQIGLSATVGGKSYDLGNHTLPKGPATCATGGCGQLGDLPLDPARELKTSICTITGKTVFSGTAEGGDPGLAKGSPVAGAMVFAFDPDTESTLLECIVNGLGCTFSAESNATGDFFLKVPVLTGAEVFAYKIAGEVPALTGMFWGNVKTLGCPAAPVTVPMDSWTYDGNLAIPE